MPAGQLVLEARGPPADVLLGCRLHEQAALLEAEARGLAGPEVPIPHQQFQFSSLFQINIGPGRAPEGLDAQSQVPGGREGVGPQVHDERTGRVHPLDSARGAAQVHLLYLLPVGLVCQSAVEGEIRQPGDACSGVRAPLTHRQAGTVSTLQLRAHLQGGVATRPPPPSSFQRTGSERSGKCGSFWLPDPLATWTLCWPLSPCPWETPEQGQ